VERGFLVPSELLHQRVEGFRRTDRQSIFSKLLFSVSIFLTGAKNTVKLLSGQATPNHKATWHALCGRINEQ
jgi:hypothetical protein